MLLPDSMEVRVCVPFNSRSTAWVSFDGRGRVELKRAYIVPTCHHLLLTRLLITEGDHIKVTASKFPFPTVCADKQSTDWFHSISRTLKWNERERQKSFVVVEEGPAKEERKPRLRKNDAESPTSAANGKTDEEEEVPEEDNSDEEEKFDIDDLSSENSDIAATPGKSVDSSSGSSPTTSPSYKAASRAAEAMMGISPEAHAKARARSRSRSGIRSGVDSPNRYAPVPPRQGHGHGHVQWAATVPANANEGASPTKGVTGDLRTPTTAKAHGRRTRSRSPGAPIIHAHQHPRAFAVWGQDESDSNSSDADL
jgi:NAD+ kinase